MKYGMPVMVDCADIVECSALAGELKLDFVEINMSFPQYCYDNLSSNLIKRLKKDYGLFYTIHMDEMLNPFDFNSIVSDCYFEVARKTIRFAKELDIPIINMHLQKGVYTTLPDRVVFLNDVYRDEYLCKVRSFVKMCEEEIGNSDLKIAIENVDSNAFTPSQLDAMKIFMASDVFGLTLDVGHLACLCRKDYPVFLEYRNKLVHMHLHDSDGKSAHLPLGEGSVNIEEEMKILPDGATCLIEVKNPEGLRKSIDYLRKNGVYKR